LEKVKKKIDKFLFFIYLAVNSNEWIEFYNTDRIKGKKINKKKGYKKNDK